MAKSTLSDLQLEFLQAFFSRESSYFLSGGAALAGFYFGHRETNDLDLFTLEDEVESGFGLVNQTAHELGATVEAVQTSPDFRRVLVRRGNEGVVVDLIREYVYQISRDKADIDGVRIDTPSEIFANKLCVLLSRSEIRDLVDLMILERSGLDIELALDAAAKKDTGLTPGQLAWVLADIKFGDDLIPPGNVTISELREYLAKLIERLQKIALPK